MKSSTSSSAVDLKPGPKARNETSISEGSISEQIARDLEEHIHQFKNPQRRIKYISESIGVHNKTILRLLHKEVKPAYQTVFKIYEFLLNAASVNDVLAQAPAVVVEYLKKAPTSSFEVGLAKQQITEKDLTSNPVLTEIYIMASLSGVTELEIKHRFGDYGLECLQFLRTKLVIQEISEGVYRASGAAISFSPEGLLKLGLRLADQHFKCDNASVLNKNFIGFFAEGLSEEAYLEWLRIDTEAFKKKVEVAKNPLNKGYKRAFTFTTTDHIVRGGGNE